jgi:hypothetical protein
VQVLVAAGKSKTSGRLVRQACFRFNNGEGGNGFSVPDKHEIAVGKSGVLFWG